MRRLLPLFALVPVPALAGPGFIPVQGTLTDTDGLPIDAAVDVTFRLTPDSSGATAFWTDTINVDVVAGRFAVELGANVSLELDQFATYRAAHLGITVAGDTEMPLVPLDHVPYAAWAENSGDATTLGGATLADVRAEIPATSDLAQAARDSAYDTPAELTAVLDTIYLPVSYTPAWADLTGVPAGFSDNVDNDTQLTEAQLRGLLDDNYLPTSYVPAWASISGMPTGFSDNVDNDTQLSRATVEGYARGVAYDTPAELTTALAGTYAAASTGTEDENGTAMRTCAGRTSPSDWALYSTYHPVVDVDISGCGFSTTPYITTALHGGTSHWTVVGASSVYGASATTFRIHLRDADSSTTDRYTLASTNWWIEWIAVGN